MKQKHSIITLLLFALTALSCSKSGDGQKVTFRLTDAPTYIDAAKVTIDLQEVNYSLSGESWQKIQVTPQQVNLLALTNGTSLLLSQITLNEGDRIQQVRLVLGSNNTIQLPNGTVIPLEIPGSETSGLKISVKGDVPATGGYTVMVDFDARRSLVAKGNGQYSMKPVLRGFIVESLASIKGTITPAATPYTVYTLAEADTIMTKSDPTAGNKFLLTGLRSGTYSVVFCNIATGATLKTQSVTLITGTDTDMGVVTIS